MVVYATILPNEEIEISDDIASLYQYYKFFGNEMEIIQFIRKYNLVNILLDVVREIKRVFKNNVSFLELKLQHDPEENFSGIFIIIHTNLSPKEAVDLLDKLDEEWWLFIDDEISNIVEIIVRGNGI